MKIVVASGKGGTGKTTVSVNLALVLGNCTLVDCDVEEPNCALFLGDMKVHQDVILMEPAFDLDRCTYCKECADFCHYHAIAVIPPESLLFFRELCHPCGGCAIVCQHQAIGESPRMIGDIRRGEFGGVTLYDGQLKIGEPLAVPLIRKLNALDDGDGVFIYDSPPGTSCPVVETLQGADYAVLVTEPTPFGLHDLKLAVDVVKNAGLPLGVIINRDGVGDDGVERFCEEQDIEILLRIPESRQIAELYSSGNCLVQDMPDLARSLRAVYTRIQEVVG